MESRVTSSVTELPPSCKSAQERMEAEIAKEEQEWTQPFEIAKLSEACEDKLREFEHELNKQGYWNIALVAYQKDAPKA